MSLIARFHFQRVRLLLTNVCLIFPSSSLGLSLAALTDRRVECKNQINKFVAVACSLMTSACPEWWYSLRPTTWRAVSFVRFRPSSSSTRAPNDWNRQNELWYWRKRLMGLIRWGFVLVWHATVCSWSCWQPLRFRSIWSILWRECWLCWRRRSYCSSSQLATSHSTAARCLWYLWLSWSAASSAHS